MLGIKVVEDEDGNVVPENGDPMLEAKLRVKSEEQ